MKVDYVHRFRATKIDRDTLSKVYSHLQLEDYSCSHPEELFGRQS